jgi:hypothetical protein
VLNGDESRSQRVTSGSIGIDGVQVIGPSAFGPGREAALVRIAIDRGEHELTIDSTGKPGSFFTLSVRFGSAQAPAPGELLSLTNPHATPPAFTPDANGILDDTRLAAVVHVDGAVPGNSGNHPFTVDVDFELADGSQCQPVRTLSTSLSVTPGLPVVAVVTWDGTDEMGTRVTDGNYYFRARGRLCRGTGLLAMAESAVGALTVGSDPIGDEPSSAPPIIGVRVGPFPLVSPAVPTELDLLAQARSALEAMRPEVEIAFTANLTALQQASRTFPVPGSTSMVSLPVLVAEFEVLDRWKDDSVPDSISVWVPNSVGAPRLDVGGKYAVFAGENQRLAQWRDVGGEASFLLFVSATNVQLFGQELNVAEVRSLTGTEEN